VLPAKPKNLRLLLSVKAGAGTLLKFALGETIEVILELRTMERCAICGCELHRTRDTYATSTLAGRSHASEHHYVAERFFGRSNNRRGTQRIGIFERCPWGHEGKREVFCYECHEELLHNPVLLPEDVKRLAELVRERGLSEEMKSEHRSQIAGRILLFHEVIARGLRSLLDERVTDQQNGKS
jgi:hypothetical protein